MHWDILVVYDGRSSAESLLTTFVKNIQVFRASIISCNFCWLYEVIQNGRQDLEKWRGSPNVDYWWYIHTHFSLTRRGSICAGLFLIDWGRVTHICASELTIIGSDNGLSPSRSQVIIWTNDGILLMAPLGTNFSEILFGIQTFSFNKMHLKMSSAKWRPFCLGLNVPRNIKCICNCLLLDIEITQVLIPPWTKWRPFRKQFLQMYFREWKVLYFD